MARKLPAQPEVNIGLVGHVDHGKTTLTQALSGIWTDTGCRGGYLFFRGAESRPSSDGETRCG